MSGARFIVKPDGYGCPRAYDTLECRFAGMPCRTIADAQHLVDVYTGHPNRVELIDKAGPMPPRIPRPLPQIVCVEHTPVPEETQTVDCPQCGGDGVWESDECDLCDGNGALTTIPECPACDGVGVTDDGECPRCEATGEWRHPLSLPEKPQAPKRAVIRIRRR